MRATKDFTELCKILGLTKVHTGLHFISVVSTIAGKGEGGGRGGELLMGLEEFQFP